MKIIGIIPARYASTRFHGKPLADIHGKPMVWWVYQQAKKVTEFDEIYIATDSDLIKNVCDEYSLNVIMTRDNHETVTSRIQEVSDKIVADIYAVVNGDEPLIDPKIISAVIPKDLKGFYASNLMAAIKDPVEVVDITNIKVVFGHDMSALFMTRAPVPYPKATHEIKYYKHLGVVAYCKEALDFFVSTDKGYNENVEDIDYLRFIEHKKPFKMIEVDTQSISVDTKKDLEHVKKIMESKGF